MVYHLFLMQYIIFVFVEASDFYAFDSLFNFEFLNLMSFSSSNVH